MIIGNPIIICGKSVSSNDNGKVVVNGELTTQTSLTVTENNTYDTTAYNEVIINVPTSSLPAANGNSF